LEIFKDKNENEIENLRKSIQTFFNNPKVMLKKKLEEEVSEKTGLTWEYFKTLRKQKTADEI
jgi:hypothetical protein